METQFAEEFDQSVTYVKNNGKCTVLLSVLFRPAHYRGIVGQSLWLGVVIAMLLCSGALMYRAVMGEPSPSVLAARSTEKASTNEPCAISSYEPNEPALETNAIILKSNLQRVDKKKKQFRVGKLYFHEYVLSDINHSTMSECINFCL